jgi:hypothetical protein
MEWGPVITAIGTILTPIGLGFGYLIREIVKSSKDAVTELKLERDMWRDRALKAGWKGDQ